MITSLLSTPVIAGLAIALLALILAPLFSPLRSIPGPFFARWSRGWMLYRLWLGRFDRDLLELHRKHGPIVRFGPYHYSFNSPDAIDRIHGHGTELDKSSWYESWNDPGFKTLFSEPSVKAHAQMRRKFQPTFTMSNLVSYESFANECIALLCKRLEEIANGPGETDLSRWTLAYSSDAVSMISYSKRVGFLDAGEDVGDMWKTLHGNFAYSTFVGVFSEIHPPIVSFMKFIQRLKLGTGTPRMFLARFTSKLIEQRRAERSDEKTAGSLPARPEDSTPRDMLSKFLDLHDQEPARFTLGDVTVGLLGNVIAGSDSTGGALTAILYCLLKDPRVLQKLRDEISAAREAGALSSPPTFKEAHDLPYLHAVIHEAMRMYVHVGLPLQRIVPAGGREIGGVYFPPGTVVGATPSAVHMNPTIYGQDAHVFRPERWIDSSKETLAVMNRYWAPFGLGSRTCIGQNISMLEMKKVVPVLVSTFDLELAGELRAEGAEMQWLDRWFVGPVALPVQVRLRGSLDDKE
ncbi:cytochrome P450 [Neohortaea acidophila]|uniref:Cytochrome P450 n=1 Tax=Neohortaea acidophila TaxID=245834 RepID=A0A6A6PHW0_9PEZI|nr:cytochrome P450 [Neohortaea acidophila]KAF2479600.1 cytochrome P450 [Neohortaea acidophila]